MKYRFKNNLLAQNRLGGFSLVEAAAALVLLGFMCSGVLVVINRAMEATADSILKQHAFEVARENMEKVLTLKEVSEKTEYGYSEKYPEIEWTTTIETFYEPVDNKMWVQAVCSAEYADSKGELAKVELTHWLNKLSEQQTQQVAAGRKQMEDFMDLKSLLESDEFELPDINDIGREN